MEGFAFFMLRAALPLDFIFSSVFWRVCWTKVKWSYVLFLLDEFYYFFIHELYFCDIWLTFNYFLSSFKFFSSSYLTSGSLKNPVSYVLVALFMLSASFSSSKGTLTFRFTLFLYLPTFNGGALSKIFFWLYFFTMKIKQIRGHWRGRNPWRALPFDWKSSISMAPSHLSAMVIILTWNFGFFSSALYFKTSLIYSLAQFGIIVNATPQNHLRSG